VISLLAAAVLAEAKDGATVSAATSTLVIMPLIFLEALGLFSFFKDGKFIMNPILALYFQVL